MTKEWKCADCVKYKTDACSTCACGYTPTVACRDVLVDFDYAYQQGRAEAIDEFADMLKAFIDDNGMEEDGEQFAIFSKRYIDIFAKGLKEHTNE